jgi:hypothetical protein
MTNGSAASTPAPPDDRRAPDPQDDDTVATPPRGATTTTTPDGKNQEKTLRFRFPVMTGGNSIVAPPVLHYHFIAAVQDAFGDTIQFIDNKNRVVNKIDVVRFDIKVQKNLFKWYSGSSNKQTGTMAQPPDAVNPNDRHTTKYVSHRIRTSLSMAEIKSNERVKKLLIDHNFYVNFHRWDETEWDIVQLGFFFGLDPTFLNVDQATSTITADLQAAIAAKPTPRPKMPKFKLVFGSPKITIKNKAVRTKAYAIESQRSTSGELIKLLKEAYKTTGSFVAYQMRQRSPDALHKLIRAQTQFIANNRVILLNNIGEGAIFYVEPHITAIPGVQGLLPTRNSGQYKVSVQQKDFNRVRQHLVKNLEEWYTTHVTTDAQNVEGRFTGPPAVSAISADDYSDDEQSYMTVSINAAMSLVSILSDDEDQTGTRTSGQTNDSSKAKPVPTSITGWPTLPGGSTTETTSTPTQYSALDQTILNDLASSRAEVEALKVQVTQLVAQRDSQAQQIADAVHAQVTRALATQSVNQPTHQSSVTQDQFSAFLNMQEAKFDIMANMFREMMNKTNQPDTSVPVDTGVKNPPQNRPTSPSVDQSGTTATKRNATEDLEQVLEADASMEIDSDTATNSRKRNDQRGSPSKHGVQLFPLFRFDSRNKDVARKLFGGPPLPASPSDVPLPPSPVRDASSTASLTAAEDVQQRNSSGTESKQSTQSASQADDDLSETTSTC